MNIIERIPVLPLRALTVFPNTSVSIDVTRNTTVKAMQYALDNKSRIVLITQRNPNVDAPGQSDLYTVGTLCDISKIMKVDEKTYRILVDGIMVVDIGEFHDGEDFLSCDCYERESTGDITEPEFLAFKSFIIEGYDALEDRARRKYPKHIRQSLVECDNAVLLLNIATGLMSPQINKQALLEETDIKTKLDKLCDMMGNDIAYATVLNEIDSRVQEKITSSNKEFILREQMRIIEDELGNSSDNVKDDYIKKINELNAEQDIKDKLIKDVERYGRMNETAPESAIIRNYLDWVLELPWGEMSPETAKLSDVKRILDEDHYGLEKVKQRIVEFLAVRLLTKGESKGTALCLVGAPGVGKTSIAKSIARALGKDYIQLTLGGVHDEAEIRGHRKTYIGAMPGRIMSSLAKSKTNNPLFLLDEVDKITRDMRGDPSSALLEVLDPNQNKTFRDNYLEIPYDLSNVMFVLTANDISEMDKPLLDRLEIIEMEGYTVEEKIAIASKYLVPKQAKEHGLNIDLISIGKSVIREIIEGYTRESGVRELERQIAALCRKIAYNIVLEAEGNETATHCNKIKITVSNLSNYIGAVKYDNYEKNISGSIGRVTGLAWTSVGGTTLDIEVCIMPGKGDIKLTGSLGDVMKESAVTAISVIRSKAKEYGIKDNFFSENDIHIHVPKGATPKDGPSAGITMATAVLSAILGRQVKAGVAMTGEISLNGSVLAIGGLKEKSLAGQRAGANVIIIPNENKKDLDNIPISVKKNVNFITVDNIDEVFIEALFYEN